MPETELEIPSLPFSLLGEFTIEFERICFFLRNSIINSFGISGEKSEKAIELLFTRLTAGPLLEMFVAVSKSANSLTPNETKVLMFIEKEMGKLIADRNDFLHGTWFRPSAKEEAATSEYMPGIRKTKTNGQVVTKYMDLSAEEVRPKIDRCTNLINNLAKFEQHKGTDDFDLQFPSVENS
ncbi:MAG: hypothetical protein WC798_03980 [Candidatus Paceibacterota bacterium]